MLLSGSNFGSIFSAWGLSLFKPIAWMTDDANGSVGLAELKVFFKECNNQRLSQWIGPFFCSLDLIADLFVTTITVSPPG